jgi:hypothetical protein
MLLFYVVHMMEQYKGATGVELRPHLFAIVDSCYRCVHVIFVHERKLVMSIEKKSPFFFHSIPRIYLFY